MSKKGSGYPFELERPGAASVVESSDGKLSINVPINLKRRSGRRLITLPDGTVQEPRPWDTQPTPLQLALARGHRWLQMLETGEVSSLREIAQLEGLDNSYISRMVNLTTLAPDIVEAILDDCLPPNITLFDLAVDPPRLWSEQRARINNLGFKGGNSS
ncbi:LacI family transcriptional regulator [Vibrio cholerae]|nr:LacI family transcriptional regulator [Vibrio cholerae]